MKYRVLLAVVCLISFGASGLAKEPALVIDSGGNTRYVRKVIFTRDGNQLVSVGDERVIRVWDIKTGKTVRTIRDQVGACNDCAINDIALSPDNTWLAVGGQFPGTTPEERFAIYIYNFETGERFQQLRGHGFRVISLAFSADGKQLASGSDYFKRNDRSETDAPVRLWRLEPQGWQFALRLQGHNEAVSNLAFSTNGERLASGGTDGSLFLWSLNSGTPHVPKQLQNHFDAVVGVAFLPDGRLVSAGLDRRIDLWDAQGNLIKEVGEQPSGIRSMDLSADNDSARLLVGLEDGNTRVLSLPDGKVMATFKKDRDLVRAVAFSGIDKTVIASTGGFNGEISLWNVNNGNPVLKMTLAGMGRSVWRVGFAKDSKSIAFGTERTSDVPNNYGPFQQFIGLDSSAFGKGGSQISMGGKVDSNNYDSARTEVGEYKLKTRYGELMKRRAGPNLFVDEPRRLNELMIYRNGEKVDSIERNSQTGRTHLCFTFTKDGRYIISGGENGYLALYNTNNPGKPEHEFRGHTNDVWSVAVSNDGRFVLSGSSDQTIKLWDIQSETYLLSIFVSADNEWIAWTPQGYYTSSLNGDKYVGWLVESDGRSEFYKAAQFQKLFYRPDVIARFLATRDIQSAVEQAGPSQSIKVSGNDISGVVSAVTVAENPPPDIEILAPDDNLTVSDRMLKVKILVTSAKLPITNVQVSLNGFEKGTFKGMPEDNERSRKVEIEMVVVLKPKANTLIVYAANDVANSKPQTRTITYKPLDAVPEPNQRASFSKIKYAAGDRASFKAARVRSTSPAPPAPTIRIVEPEESATPIDISDESFILRVLVPSSTDGRNIKVKILVNGQEQNNQDITPGVSLPLNIALADDGEYTISAIAIADGVESAPQLRRIRYVNPRPDKPNLYFLGIGIKGYTVLSPSLDYADKDAKDLETLLLGLKNSPLFNDVQTKVISNADATSDRIFQEIKALNDKAIHKNDVRVVLFSGHGGVYGNVLRDYYFYVQNYDPTKDPEPGSPNWAAILKRLLDPGVKSGRGPVLLFVDTCRAGAATPKRFMDFEALNGLVFFAASGANQKANEDGRWKNGAFTRAVLEGLSGCADSSTPERPSDDLIDFDELGSYIRKRVKELNSSQSAEWIPANGLELFDISLGPSRSAARAKLQCSGVPNQ